MLNRTIADMAGSQSTIHTHLAEAPRNRPKLVLM
jgi:predicted ATPase with chaperone activity